MKINRLFDSIFWFAKNPLKDTHMKFWMAALPYIAGAGMSLAQHHFGGKQADKQRRRQEEQGKKDRLMASFGQQPAQRPQEYQQQGMAQKLLSDPLTKSLVGGLVQKGQNKLSQTPTGGSGGAGVQIPKMDQSSWVNKKYGNIGGNSIGTYQFP